MFKRKPKLGPVETDALAEYDRVLRAATASAREQLSEALAGHTLPDLRWACLRKNGTSLPCAVAIWHWSGTIHGTVCNLRFNSWPGETGHELIVSPRGIPNLAYQQSYDGFDLREWLLEELGRVANNAVHYARSTDDQTITGQPMRQIG